MVGGLITLANRLALQDGTVTAEPVSREALRTAALDCLRRWRNDDRAGRGAMAVVIAAEWVQNIARLEADLDRPVTVAVEAARTPWWR
jgi:hypothetical protein